MKHNFFMVTIPLPDGIICFIPFSVSSFLKTSKAKLDSLSILIGNSWHLDILLKNLDCLLWRLIIIEEKDFFYFNFELLINHTSLYIGGL